MLYNQWSNLSLAVFVLLVLSSCGPSGPRNSFPPASVLLPLHVANDTSLTTIFYDRFCQKLNASDKNDQVHKCRQLLNPVASLTKPASNSRNSLNTVLKTSLLTVVIVPGYLGECVAEEVTPFKFSAEAIGNRYSGIRFILANGIRGRASSTHNAQQLAETIDQLSLRKNEKLIILAYSKGVTDTLHFLASHNKQSENKIDAFISIAGVVNGTGIGDTKDFLLKWLAQLPNDKCPIQDDDGIDSISFAKQFDWLSRHRELFGEKFAMYSLLNSSPAANTSVAFKKFWIYLDKYWGQNDGQVNLVNQVLPNSKILGHANADHWAIALPFRHQKNESLSLVNRLVAQLATKNQYPREALLEAILEIVVYDLERSKD